MGVGGSPGVSRSGDRWCTLGGWHNIGDDGIAGCRSAIGSFLLAITLRIVARGVNTIVCGGNGAGCDATGGGTTLGGSIAAVTGGGGRTGGGCSGYNLANIRAVASYVIGGIERGSQLLKSLHNLVIAVSCSW